MHTQTYYIYNLLSCEWGGKTTYIIISIFSWLFLQDMELVIYVAYKDFMSAGGMTTFVSLMVLCFLLLSILNMMPEESLVWI